MSNHASTTSPPPPPPPSKNSAAPIPDRTSFSGSRSPHSRNPSLHLAHMPSPASQHRQSFTESLRGLPPSPRAQRQPSLSQLAIQDLIDNPPARNDPAFAGRDWRTVNVAELVSPEDLKFAEVNTGVEVATNLLIDSGAPVLLIRESPSSRSVTGTFDYADLNAYLLLVVGLAQPDEGHIEDFRELARKARTGAVIPLKDVKDLGRKEPLVKLPNTASLIQAIETFGSGVHRVIVVEERTDEVVGILSQSRVVKFLWENGRSFPVIDQLYPQYLRDLKIGSHQVVSINGDKPLTEALTLLMDEGVSSLAVLDNARNVIGNISTVDVKLLTKSSSLPLLRNTCIHFISVILSTRGMQDGKDSYPVFYVTQLSTLAHTVAKLVATKSHRLWITEPASPSSSGPTTPLTHTATMVPTSSHNSSISPSTQSSLIAPSPPPSSHGLSSNSASPFIAPSGPSISASAMPGASISGHLVGVISLTDILNLFARASGLHPTDPNEIRKGRRRSSSSSVRKSGELGIGPRGSADSSRGPAVG
ncbi:cell separation during budding protein [Endocarpon pusillum]|uniref:Protein SDS23 n=1 Tax=Endocarpon pusillum TaxID=364733 RepID=A0A8H7A949_9EURO|nr:cell separation during budding protein [Endocarpon pusillum]